MKKKKGLNIDRESENSVGYQCISRNVRVIRERKGKEKDRM